MAGIVSKKFSYQKLKQEVIFEEDLHHQNKSKKDKISEIIRRSSTSIRSRSSWINKLKLRRKFRVKLGRCFRRFFRIRRNKKLKVARLAWANKVYKRLKEGQSHFGDLFAGNYLFMQVTPGSFVKNNKTHCVSSHQFYNHSNTTTTTTNKLSRYPSSYTSNYVLSS
ncbi:uncharacterized protein LOC110729989 [Chenopodium quinoa]|uniref:uncharacterized protein LOC110729989 n=1 Tax=Chenopodium quinoa TaxID=63459 RepID=UPI000B7856A6|nr:uncharacterized protein LOC110729989 [Chenopodium quinoa]